MPAVLDQEADAKKDSGKKKKNGEKKKCNKDKEPPVDDCPGCEYGE